MEKLTGMASSLFFSCLGNKVRNKAYSDMLWGMEIAIRFISFEIATLSQLEAAYAPAYST
jgi:hypothetical protein